jgi:phosphatidylserine/phosphatidylglycerophosphate/cardiolipin synthase-like enzyme
VFERQNATGTGSEYAKLKGGGVNVLYDGNCYILHHKIIIIDDRTVITGSYNFTGSAERDNDENLVIIDDPAIARTYLDEFNRTYAQAQTPTRCG